VLSIIATFQTFTSAFVATNGGPLDSTLFYVLYLYRQAFQYLNMGYASLWPVPVSHHPRVDACDRPHVRPLVYYEGEEVRRSLRAAPGALAVVAVAVLFLLPLFWMISSSLKPEYQVARISSRWLPDPVVWSNFRKP